MKTITALAMLLLLTTLAYSQKSIESHFAYPEWEVYALKSNSEKHNVNVYIVEKNEKRLSQTIVFNTNGSMEQSLVYSKNGKIKFQTTEYYNDSNKPTQRTTHKKGNFSSRQNYTYTSDLTQIIRTDHYYKDSLNIKRHSVFTYYPNGKYKWYAGYDKKGKETYRYEYDFYENGSKKETRNYNKGKLKYRWVYDCDWRGELSTDKESQIKICQNRMYDTDSSYTEVYESTVKNKVTKTITKATKDGRILEQELYNVKGKLLHKTVCQYNEAKKLVKKTRYEKQQDNPVYMEIYEYNTDNYLVSSSRFDKGVKVQSRKEFVYN
jgi:hypothetical protein